MKLPCYECLKYPICKHKKSIYCDALYRYWAKLRVGRDVFPSYMFPNMTSIGLMPEFVKKQGLVK